MSDINDPLFFDYAKIEKARQKCANCDPSYRRKCEKYGQKCRWEYPSLDGLL